MAIWVPRISHWPLIPLLFAQLSLSIISPTAPAPMMVPLRSSSNGLAASDTLFLMVAAPTAKNPDSTQGPCFSELMFSPPMTITLLHLPTLIQSSAIPMARVVEAHAALTSVLGPLALITWARCAAPRGVAFARKFLSNLKLPNSGFFLDLTLKNHSVSCSFISVSLIFSIR